MQAKPDKRILTRDPSKAQGIHFARRHQGGLLVRLPACRGVALVKDSRTGEWSPASFVGANEVSQGLQIGSERSLTVILIMNADATWALVGPVNKFGGEASGTAGNATGRTEGAISPVERPAMVYSDRHGLYAGAAIKGGSSGRTPNANLVYYKQSLSAKEILFDGKVKPTAAGKQLAQKIIESSK